MKYTKRDAGRLGGLKSSSYFKKQKELRILDYNIQPKQCINCNSIIPYELRRNKFCSRSCSVSVANLKRIKRTCCLNCKAPIKRHLKYCNVNCRKTFKLSSTHDKFVNGKLHDPGTLNDYLRGVRGNKCEECNWDKIHPVTKKVPLQVHHLDGNAKNNRPENLQLLCPNCHSLTSTFGNLNKGKGRTSRYGYRN